MARVDWGDWIVGGAVNGAMKARGGVGWLCGGGGDEEGASKQGHGEGWETKDMRNTEE